MSPYRSPSREDLGRLLRVHGRRTLGELLVREAKDLGLVLFLALTVLVYFFTGGPAEDPVRGPAFRWFAGVLLGAVGLLVAVHVARWAQLERRFVAVHAGGLAAEGPDGVFCAGWSDIRAVRVDTSTELHRDGLTTNTDVWICRADGARIHLTDELEALEELALELVGQTRPHLLAAARERIAAGHSVSFGGIELSTAGLASRTTGLIPWRDVESCAIVDGSLVIRAGSGTIERPVGAVDNADVLVELVRRRSTDSSAMDPPRSALASTA